MNKEQKEEILKEVNKMSRPVTEGILAVLNHKIGIDKASYENYQKLLQETYYTEEHIRKAIEETSKHYEEKLTQTNLRNHSREQNIKKEINERIDEILFNIKNFWHKAKNPKLQVIRELNQLKNQIPPSQNNSLIPAGSNKRLDSASGDSNSKKYTEEECDCKMFVGGSGKLCPECKDNFEQYKDAVIEDRRHIK